MLFDIGRYWYRKSLHPLTLVLLPLSWPFAAIAALRRWLYASGKLKVHHARVPVIVVGNITVGGTGKTPFVIWLANDLRARGYKPGIVSRGVGGKRQSRPRRVFITDAVEEVGDEALLIIKNTACPMTIAVDRVAAVNHLLAATDCDIIISDDGLQHYRMGRDMEIALVDGVRRMGNKQLLPAGPLREPVSRLQDVDFVIVNGGNVNDAYSMRLDTEELVSVQDEKHTIALRDFSNREVHAVAAIGHPERFFLSLRNAGFTLAQHHYPDHHLLGRNDFNFQDALPIIMTEKDAIKCREFADQRFWYLRVSVKMNEGFERDFIASIQSLEAHYETGKNSVHAVPVPDHVGGNGRGG